MPAEPHTCCPLRPVPGGGPGPPVPSPAPVGLTGSCPAPWPQDVASSGQERAHPFSPSARPGQPQGWSCRCRWLRWPSCLRILGAAPGEGSSEAGGAAHPGAAAAKPQSHLGGSVASHCREGGWRTGLRCCSSVSVPAPPRAASADSPEHRALGKEGTGLRAHLSTSVQGCSARQDRRPEGSFASPCASCGRACSVSTARVPCPGEPGAPGEPLGPRKVTLSSARMLKAWL